MRPAGQALAVAVAAAAVVQVGPAGSWLPGLRPRRWCGLGPPGSLALTFDDGPDPAGTPAVLDALERCGWPATFFVLGVQVRRDPGLCREIADRGHEVALHGDTHRYLIGRTPRSVADDLARGRDTVEQAIGRPVHWWRPPYGVLSGPALHAARRLGLRPVIWTSWGKDWTAGATAAGVVREVTRRRLGGSTVLLHDSDLMSVPGSWRATADAVPLLIGQAQRHGLTGGTLTAHVVGRGA